MATKNKTSKDAKVKTGKAKAAKVLTRDQIRAKIFKKQSFENRIFPLYGTKIELRQPSVGDIMNARKEEGESEMTGILSLLAEYCYVPETQEKIFESGDAEELLALPFTPEFAEVNAAILEMTGIRIKDEVKN